MVIEAAKAGSKDELLSRYEASIKKLTSTEKLFQKLNSSYKDVCKRKEKYKVDLTALENKYDTEK